MEPTVTKQTILDIDSSMSDLVHQRDTLAVEHRSIELELQVYNNRIRTANQRLPQDEYRRICAKQLELKKRLGEIDKQILEINRGLRSKYALKSEVQKLLKVNNFGIDDKDLILKVKGNLIDIKRKYADFSSDLTRVASMRAMASKFSAELEEVIRLIPTLR